MSQNIPSNLTFGTSIIFIGCKKYAFYKIVTESVFVCFSYLATTYVVNCAFSTVKLLLEAASQSHE